MNEPIYCRYCGQRINKSKNSPGVRGISRLQQLVNLLMAMPDEKFDTFIEVARTIASLHPQRPLYGSGSTLRCCVEDAARDRWVPEEAREAQTARDVDNIVPF